MSLPSPVYIHTNSGTSSARTHSNSAAESKAAFASPALVEPNQTRNAGVRRFEFRFDRVRPVQRRLRTYLRIYPLIVPTGALRSDVPERSRLPLSFTFCPISFESNDTSATEWNADERSTKRERKELSIAFLELRRSSPR